MQEKRIGFELCQCARLLRRYTDLITAKNQIDEMTGTHGRVIGYFYHNRDKEIFQKDFEKRFNIRRSTASNILSLMEKNGLIVREGVPYDARLKKITLTERAMEIHEQIEADFNKMEEDIARGLSEEEKLTFFLALDKIRNNIERMTAEND